MRWTIITTGAIWVAAGLLVMYGNSEIASGLLIGNGVALLTVRGWREGIL